MKQLAPTGGKRPLLRTCIRSARHAVFLALSVLVSTSMAAQSSEPVQAEVLRVGEAALEDGFYELAEKEFLAYLSLAAPGTPEAERAAVLLAGAYHGRKKYADILSLLSSVGGSAAAYWRAMAYYELKEYDKVPTAVAVFDGQQNSDPYAIHARRLLADSYLQTGRTNEALRVFETINEANRNEPDSGAAALDWARTLVAAGQNARARKVLGDLIKRSPADINGQHGRALLGRLLVANGELVEAESVLDSLIDQKDAESPSRTSAMITMADIHVLRGKFVEATNILSGAIELAPDRRLKRQGELSLGRLLLKMKQLDDGVAVLNTYIAAVPPDPAAPILQLEVADSFLDAGNADRAVEAYQHYLETFSDKRGKAEAFSGKAWALLLQPKPAYAEAASAFRQAYELFVQPADKARCLIKAADCLFSNKQFVLAAKTYEQALSEFPDSPLAVQALFQTAECAARTKRPDDAERLFRNVIATNPVSTFAEQSLMRIAEIKEDQGELTSALSVYDQLMNTYTNSTFWPNARLSHGLINYRKLLFEAALLDFEKLVGRFPESEAAEQAAYMRGRCFQILGPEEKAASTWREFLLTYRASKWTPHVLFRLGEYAFNRSDFKEAEKQFANIADKYPDAELAPAALLAAGESAAKQKEYLQAIEHYALLVNKYPRWPNLAKVRYEQGDATAELGEYAKAVLIFEEIIEKYGNSDLVDMALFRKADCEFALGLSTPARYESAIASYKLVAGRPLAPPDLKLQAQYKIGACLQKMQRPDEAVEQLYSQVILPYLDDPRGLLRDDAACEVWFTRAALDIVERLESQKKWREAIKILKRVVDAGVPAADEAQKRIDKIRLQQWILP